MLKSRVIFIVALIGAAVLTLIYEDLQVGFTLLYALLILCAFCAVSIALAPLCLRLDERVDKDVIFKGEPVSYSISLQNRGPFLYPGGRYRFYSSELIALEAQGDFGVCEPFKGQTREYGVRFPYRGVYALGLQSVVVTDMLGLFARTIQSKKPLSLSVLPNIDEAFSLSMYSDPQSAVMRQDILNEDHSSIADLRKYNPADSLRKIHWKLSAKRSELITKNFQNFEPYRTILLLDTTKIDLPENERMQFEDKMACCAASAADYFATAKMPASLVYGEPGLDEMPVSASGRMDELYLLLANIRFEREKSPVFEMCKLHGMYNTIALLSGIDDEICGALKALVSFDRSIRVCLFFSESRPVTREQERQLEELRSYGISASTVSVEGEEDDDRSPEEGGAA